MTKKDFLPIINKVIESDVDEEVVKLFYKVEDESIVGESELSWIIEICTMFSLDFIPFITGKQDINILRMLELKMQIDDEVSKLPYRSPDKKTIKKEEKGKVLVFDPKSPTKN